MSEPSVSLSPILEAEAPVLANLLELYCHDMSAYFPIQLGDDGRFGYPSLASYFREPETRFAYFIRCSGKLAGFALATRGSPVSPLPEALDVAEFFVLRAQRQRGVGALAARQLWSTRRGRWLVRVALANTPALSFWRRAAAAQAGSLVAERGLRLSGVDRIVLEFDS
jgi:predicted acetyltransferase